MAQMQVCSCNITIKAMHSPHLSHTLAAREEQQKPHHLQQLQPPLQQTLPQQEPNQSEHV
jgi:hypothetical protein